MTKKKRTHPTVKTNFEQVSLKVVKKIVYRQAQKSEKARPLNVIFEPSWRKAEPYSVPTGFLAAAMLAGHVTT